jgi:hypothetical protein
MGRWFGFLQTPGSIPAAVTKQDHALGPLKQSMVDFGANNLRLDLVIGTHYDADHLEGLMPIIADRDITITEAWMPPVANDTEPHALEDEPLERKLLPKQLESENGETSCETISGRSVRPVTNYGVCNAQPRKQRTTGIPSEPTQPPRAMA